MLISDQAKDLVKNCLEIDSLPLQEPSQGELGRGLCQRQVT